MRKQDKISIMQDKINVLIISDQPIFTAGLRYLLREDLKEVLIDRVFVVHEPSEIKRFPYWGCIDVVMTECYIQGVPVTPLLQPHLDTDQKIILIGQETSPEKIQSVISKPISGFLHYKSDTILISKCLKEVMFGRGFIAIPSFAQIDAQSQNNKEKEKTFSTYLSLTNREMEVLNQIYQAKSNKEIAEDLYISHQTVNVHRKNLMKKLGVNNSVALIRKAQDLQIIER